MGKPENRTTVDRLPATLRGFWWDEIWEKDARGVEHLVEITPVKHNLITVNAGVLLAGLLANDGGFLGGLTYFAIGEGDAAWDTLPVDPAYADVALVAELARVVPTSIAYTDSDGNPLVGRSNWIKIMGEFDYASPANGHYVREMGLFGGDATAAADSGQMLDEIRHTKRYKDATVKFIRYIRLGL